MLPKNHWQDPTEHGRLLQFLPLNSDHDQALAHKVCGPQYHLGKSGGKTIPCRSTLRSLVGRQQTHGVPVGNKKIWMLIRRSHDTLIWPQASAPLPGTSCPIMWPSVASSSNTMPTPTSRSFSATTLTSPTFCPDMVSQPNPVLDPHTAGAREKMPPDGRSCPPKVARS